MYVYVFFQNYINLSIRVCVHRFHINIPQGNYIFKIPKGKIFENYYGYVYEQAMLLDY